MTIRCSLFDNNIIDSRVVRRERSSHSIGEIDGEKRKKIYIDRARTFQVVTAEGVDGCVCALAAVDHNKLTHNREHRERVKLTCLQFGSDQTIHRVHRAEGRNV